MVSFVYYKSCRGQHHFTYVSGGTLGTSVIHRIDDSCYMTLNKDLNTHEIPPATCGLPLSITPMKG